MKIIVPQQLSEGCIRLGEKRADLGRFGDDLRPDNVVVDAEGREWLTLRDRGGSVDDILTHANRERIRFRREAVALFLSLVTKPDGNREDP